MTCLLTDFDNYSLRKRWGRRQTPDIPFRDTSLFGSTRNHPRLLFLFQRRTPSAQEQVCTRARDWKEEENAETKEHRGRNAW